MTCAHNDTKVIGEWRHYPQPGDKMELPTLLVRECQVCGAIHIGNGPNFYQRWPKQGPFDILWSGKTVAEVAEVNPYAETEERCPHCGYPPRLCLARKVPA